MRPSIRNSKFRVCSPQRQSQRLAPDCIAEPQSAGLCSAGHRRRKNPSRNRCTKHLRNSKNSDGIKNMRQMIGAAILFLVIFLHPATTRAQAGRLPQPQRGQRATLPAKPQPPLTLRQVIESLSSPRGGSRAEDLVSKRGVQFQASPAVLDILKEFGASPKLLSMIPVPPVPPPPPKPPAPKVAGALTVICEPKDCAVIVDDKYIGATSENQKTLTGLHAGDVTVEVQRSRFSLTDMKA